jgi:hypothetical protein
VRTNATITAWERRTGANAHGEPTFTPESGTWRILLEVRARRLKIGERDLVSTCRAYLSRNPGIAAGDRVTLLGSTYTVLAVESTPGATVGHDLLFLG